MSNTNQYLFGPWKIDEAEDLPLAVIEDTEMGEGVAEIGDRTPRNLAIARLIVEAPAMLALLESLTFTAETVAHMRGLEREILPTTDKARELIARVKG